jgi:hypothetical protein
MRPNGSNLPTSILPGPIGLLLEEDEAIDVMERYTSTIRHLFLSLLADLQTELFLISDGHVGVLTALLGVLREVPVSVLHKRDVY